jgi:hypothetical protein
MSEVQAPTDLGMQEQAARDLGSDVDTSKKGGSRRMRFETCATMTASSKTISGIFRFVGSGCVPSLK